MFQRTSALSPRSAHAVWLYFFFLIRGILQATELCVTQTPRLYKQLVEEVTHDVVMKPAKEQQHTFRSPSR